jgi:hypothetical protein
MTASRFLSAVEATTPIEDYGPNHGLSYVTTFPLRTGKLHIDVNEQALARNSDFAQLQDPDRPGSAALEDGQCHVSDVPGMKTEVSRHENLHAAKFNEAVDSHLPEHKTEIESDVHEDLNRFTLHWRQVEQAWYGEAAAFSGHEVDHGPAENLFHPYNQNHHVCNLRYFRP